MSVEGSAEVNRLGKAGSLPLATATQILPTDTVTTGDAKVLFEFGDGVQVYLNKNTRAQFATSGNRRLVRVLAGEVYCDEPSKPVEVVTPSGTITIPAAGHKADRPASATAPAAETGWRSLFNGRDLTGWKNVHGTARLESGEIVLEGMVHILYPGRFTEYDLKFDMKAENPVPYSSLISVHLGQQSRTSDDYRLCLSIYTDGDLHAWRRGGHRLWKAGGGLPDVSEWAHYGIKVRRNTLSINVNGRLFHTLDVSNEPLLPGGIMFDTSLKNRVTRVKNIRLREAEGGAHEP